MYISKRWTQKRAVQKIGQMVFLKEEESKQKGFQTHLPVSFGTNHVVVLFSPTLIKCS